MKKNQRRLWFVAKRFGWGWVPATWEGWAVTAGYGLAVWWGVSTREAFVPVTAVATGLLLFICFKTGEKPRWRWGK